MTEHDRPVCMLPDCDRVVEYPDFTSLCNEHEDANLRYANAQWFHPVDGSPCESGPAQAGETICLDHDRYVQKKEIDNG